MSPDPPPPSTTIWGFQPSTAANAVFIFIFAIATVAHIYSRIRLRAGFFTALIVGGIFEVVGYSARTAGSRDLGPEGPYIIESLFLLLAPILFAATLYMVLGRVIYATKSEQYSLIRLKWLTKTFVISDITCFLIQGTGGGFESSRQSPALRTTGKWIVVTGLILQIAAFLCFCYVAAVFHRRLKRVQGVHGGVEDSPAAGIQWQRIMHVLYACSTLIVVRNVVRVVEYIEGFRGFIITHEYFLFIFDAALMLLLLIILFVWHPARMLEGHLQGYRDRKKREEQNRTSTVVLPFWKK